MTGRAELELTRDVPGAGLPRPADLGRQPAYVTEEQWMRPSKFSEEQIKHALRQVRAGTPAVQVCRELGITQTTFYRWRKKYEDAPEPDARGARELLEENHRLKEIVADLMLDKKGSKGFKGR